MNTLDLPDIVVSLAILVVIVATPIFIATCSIVANINRCKEDIGKTFNYHETRTGVEARIGHLESRVDKMEKQMGDIGRASAK